MRGFDGAVVESKDGLGFYAVSGVEPTGVCRNGLL
jgi:hypothetical protein